MPEAEESCQVVDFVSVSRVRHSYEILTKHSTWRIFKYDFLTFHPYYIPSLLTSVKETIQREKSKIGFLQHAHPSFRERASYP